MALVTTIGVDINSLFSSVLDLQAPQVPLVKRYTVALANGVAANQANVVWADQRTIAPSGVDSLDLQGGGLVDALGVAFAPVKLKAIIIQSAKANLNNLTLFGDANHVPILGTVATVTTLQPGGIYAQQWPALAGVAVTAGTGDIVKVTNAAGTNSVVYDIIIIGTNA